MKNDKYGIDLEINFAPFKKGIQKAKQTLDGLDEKFKTFKSNFKTGFDIDTNEADSQINKLNKSISETETKLKELGSMKNPYQELWAGTNKTFEGITDPKKLTEELDKQMKIYKEKQATMTGLKQNVAGMQSQKEDIGAKLDTSNLTLGGKLGQVAQQASIQLKNATVSFKNGIKNAMSNIGEMAVSDIKKSFTKLGETIKNVAKNSVQFAINMFKKLSSTILNTGKRLLGFNNQNNKMSGFLNKGIANLKRFALSLFGIQTMWRAVSKAASAYMSMDSELSKNIQNTWAGLGSFLAPVLETLVSIFQKFLAYANAVMQVLTGINFVARANAKAMKSAGASAKGASKSLASFDEIQNINQGSGSGSGAGINQIEMPDVDTSKITAFVEKLKEMFNAGDYFGIGQIIGQKISEALASIPWEGIQQKAQLIASGIGQAINGFIAGLDWSVLGNTLAQGLNTAITFLNTLVNTINWGQLGSSIATGLNSAINNLDWLGLGQLLIAKWNILFQTIAGFVTTFDWTNLGTNLGKMFMETWNNINWEAMATTINDGIKGLLDSIMAFIENADWQKIGQDIWKFIKSIDWNGIIIKLSQLIGEAIAGMGLLLVGFIEDGVNSVRDYFAKKFDEAGGNIVEGLFNGIIDALANIGVWLADNVFTPFINGFKKVFGIHSPSTVMAEMGIYLIAGLKNGLLNIWNYVKSIFDNLKNKIVGAFNNINIGVQNTMNSLKNGLTNIWNTIWNTIRGVINKIIGGIEKMCNTTIRGLNKLITPLTKVGNSILKAVGISNFSFSPLGTISLPRLKIGTDNVKSDGLAYLHAGEKVVPADVVKGGYKGENNNNDETNDLLRILIDLIDGKDFNVNIDENTIGRTSVNYINRQRRIKGGSVV